MIPHAAKTAERSGHVNPGRDDRREATPGDLQHPREAPRRRCRKREPHTYDSFTLT